MTLKITDIHDILGSNTKCRELYAWVGDAPDGKEALLGMQTAGGAMLPLIVSSKALAQGVLKSAAKQIMTDGGDDVPTKVRLVRFKRTGVIEEL